MSKLAALKGATTLHDVAHLLEMQPRQLSYILYRLTPAGKYQTFEIAKKGGGVRVINAPIGKLKQVQRALADLLYACRAELSEGAKKHPLSHGFRKKQSIVTNARQHRNRRYVLNLDLADFFPTFNFGRVRGFFLKDKSFELNEKVATILAQIACFENSLPQGSPCSPVIADMLAHILDVRLVGLAKKQKVTYSRYADDITFSTNQKSFPEAIAAGGQAPEDPWVLGAPLIKEIERAGFSVNPAKTRMQVSASRQTVTGLTVNEKVNISQDYWRGVRSMCHALYRTGTYYRPRTTQAEKEAEPVLISSLLPLAGMLSHVHHIKRASEVKPPKGKEFFGQRDHADFWFYRTFVALDRPIVITEGKTDGIYLRNAIARLAQFQPALGAKVEGGFSFKIAFFNYENTTHRVMHLTGGIGPLQRLIKEYKTRLNRYRHRPLLAPVIILIDNDTALSKEFRATLQNVYGVTVSQSSKADFYPLTDNLYLVKTPELGVNGTSCIEDFFDAAAKALNLNGKVFSNEKNTAGFDPTKHIGKAPFAKKIVGPQADKINWTGFVPLLARIKAVLSDYKAPADPIVEPVKKAKKP